MKLKKTTKTSDEAIEFIFNKAQDEYEGKLKEIPEEVRNEFEKAISLNVIDKYWTDNINSLSHLREAQEKIDMYQKAVAQAKENYRIVKNKYSNQLSLITELIDADNTLLETESNYITAQIDKQYKYYQLQYIIGTL